MTFPAWDTEALLWMNSHHNIVLDEVLAPIAWAGEVAVIWFTTALVLIALRRPGYVWTGVMLFVTIILVDRLIAGPLGRIVDRPRPYMAIDGLRHMGIHWTSSSFPSGHAHSVWVAAVILSGKFRKLTMPLVVFALLTCYSRPYFAMHYPCDVIAGTVLGIAGGSLRWDRADRSGTDWEEWAPR